MSETQNTLAVEVENLRVSFGDGDERTEVVSGISFSIREGECLALVGESGSGKSVTSRALVGLAGERSRVVADRLALNGKDVRSLSESAWQRVRGAEVGFVLQDALASLDPLRHVGREVGEILRLHTDLTRVQREARVIELLRSVGVPEPEVRAQQYPLELSGGLRQRALIASAIAASPSLLIADEPTTALDATVAAQILQLLASLKSDSGAMLVVSHDLSVVAQIADRIAVMKNGEIVEQGSVDEVLYDPQHGYTKALLAAIPSAHSKGTRLSTATSTLTALSLRGSAAKVAAESDHRIPLIEAVGLTKAFRGPDHRDRTVVSDVSFSLFHGETLGIVGESGSGKTTTARIALGVEKATGGHVRVRGVEWASLSRRRQNRERKTIQAIYQDPLSSFDPRHTVERALSQALGIAGYGGTERKRRAIELLDLVTLDRSMLSRRPIELSGGQRQRVAIARALALDPQVIVCDEPVSALDVSVQAQILDLFDDIQREFGVSYLFISHDLGVVHHVADRVLVMKDGRVVEQGDVVDVFARPQHEYTKKLLDAIPSLDVTRTAQA